MTTLQDDLHAFRKCVCSHIPAWHRHRKRKQN